MSRSRNPSAVRPDLSRTTTSLGNELLPDGPVSEETVQLIHELVHPHHDREETLVNSEDDDEETIELARRKSLPWYKRPSPLWLIAMFPIISIAMGSTIAPKVDIYTTLACIQHKPEIMDNRSIPLSLFTLTVAPTDNVSYFSYNDAKELPGAIDIPTQKPSNPCKADPVVNAAVAQLAGVMLVCMGVLSCLTTGWWTSFSDRHGRTTSLGISVVGLLLTDANFIIVYYFSRSLPGGYWFLLLGPLAEGCLGGFTTAIATLHAYLADTTTSATRSRTFSMALGLLFSGFALGPTFGGLLIRFTGHTISVFYVATAVHFLYALMVWFIIPESNSPRKMQIAKAKYQEELDEYQTTQAREGASMLHALKRLFSFLSPLSVFAPTQVSDSGNPLKPPRRDWNLALIALSYAFTVSIMASATYKFQFAGFMFDWGPETMGYWLSLLGAARAFHLVVVLPLCIKLFKRKPRGSSSDESEPLLQSTTSAASGPRSDSPSRLTEPHSSSFDLGLAKISLVVEIIAYTLMATMVNPVAFTAFGMLGSFGSGFGPAIQSVALEMYTQRGGTEAGRLFGALSVVQALSSQIIGPALYGFVYMKTVGSYPRTIFFITVAFAVVSFMFLSLVRLPRSRVARDVPADATGHTREATLVDVTTEEEQQDRGNKLTGRDEHSV